MRQVVVERFNYEINVRVLIPVRGALFRLESLRLLDKTRPTHVGAVQFVALPLMQYGCDLLRLAWNEHKRRRIRGVLGSGGRPDELRRSHPHPGGQLSIYLSIYLGGQMKLVRPGLSRSEFGGTSVVWYHRQAIARAAAVR